MGADCYFLFTTNDGVGMGDLTVNRNPGAGDMEGLGCSDCRALLLGK